MQAGLAAGLPFADDLDDLDAGPGIGPMPVNITADGIRWNAAFAFLDPVRDAPHLRIAGRTTARRLVIRRGAATGVEVTTADGRAHTIRAGRVVLAAGAYHSPALLLASGIGPAGELRELGITPVADLPGVGRHLLDHPCAALHFAGRDGLAAELAAAAGAPTSRPSAGPGPRAATPDPTTCTCSWWPAPTAATPACHRSACTRAPCGPGPRAGSPSPPRPRRAGHRSPLPQRPGGHDRAVLAEALELLRAIMADSNLAEILGDPVDPAADPLATPASYCHPAGTCKLGPAERPRRGRRRHRRGARHR